MMRRRSGRRYLRLPRVCLYLAAATPMHFLIVPYPERGHMEPAMAVAQLLARRGHDVTFAALPDVQPVLEATGHPCLPLFADIFPRGRLAQFEPGKTEGRRRWHIAQLRQVICAVDAGAFVETLQRVRPDLVVLDALFFFLSIPAFEQGVPAAGLHVTLPWDTSYRVPPLTSGLDHQVSSWYAVRRAGLLLHSAYRDARERWLDAIGWTLDLKGRVSRMAARRTPHVRTTRRGHAVHMILDLPEIVLCPRAFDVPRRARPNRVYVGPTLRDHPADSGFPWERLSADAPLVYCALGSRVPPYPHAERLFQAVVRASRDRGMQVVVATGACPTSRDWYNQPGVTAVAAAPQQALLRRASVFVTHAGLGSVKEAIMAGVPMIAFPMLADQPGNAARIVRHGLGVAGRGGSVTAASIGNLIDAVVSDDVRRAATRMRSEFEQEERTNGACQALERLVVAASGRSRSAGRVPAGAYGQAGDTP